MKIVWAVHARQCFSMFPKCTQTKNIWQTVVSQLIKVFLPGTKKHLVNCSVSVPTAVFHPPPSTEFKPEHKYASKTCSFWNMRKSVSEQLVFNPELLGELKELMKLDESNYTVSQTHLEKVESISFQNITRARKATPAQCTENQRKKSLRRRLNASLILSVVVFILCSKSFSFRCHHHSKEASLTWPNCGDTQVVQSNTPCKMSSLQVFNNFKELTIIGQIPNVTTHHNLADFSMPGAKSKIKSSVS